MSKQGTRAFGLGLVCVLVSAGGCGQDDDDDAPSPPAGTSGESAAGRSGAGTAGKHAGTGGAEMGGSAGRHLDGGSGGRGGSSARAGLGGGGTGTAAGAGGDVAGADFGCEATVCARTTLAGSCPATMPEYDTPCDLGSTCSYCVESFECPSQREGVIVQCCPGERWGHNCYAECSDPFDGNQGGQGGGGAEGGAFAEAGSRHGLSGDGGDGGDGGEGGGDACAGLLHICCDAASDCPSGFQCAAGPGFGHAGVCKGKLADSSQCWMDADCPSEYRCDGALFCGCGQECNDEFPGHCVSR